MPSFLRLSPKAPLAYCALTLAVALPAVALPGPFAEFTGTWSGNGTIRPQTGSPERIRCTATYKPRGATDLDARLRCASDSYNFDLTGEFSADSSNAISGRWSESSRGIGGTLVGTARGSSMQVHVESSGFAADLAIVTRGSRQDVTIDSHGGGEVVKASITMNRR